MLTHRVAVAAYVFRGGKVLLLKRATPPQTFAPPGGKLEVGEDPLAGLHREVFEETGLEIEVVGVAHTWYGRVTSGDDLLLCINFLATSEHGEPRLSDEHTEWTWVARAELENGTFRTQDEQGNGYRAISLLEAFDSFARWMTTH
ncbi:MAG: NUDIX hydrolase [bacterium]|nr:NUDIX hydrolase [bacterium]